MNSKFLKICEQVRRSLIEQNLDPSTGTLPDPSAPPEVDQTQSTEQSTPQSSDEQSQLPVATNQEIISAVKSIKNFYAKDGKLDTSDVDLIRNLSDDESDENIKKVITTLNNIFNPTKKIDTNPANVPNSDLEN
jgi:hypothetical protein